MRLLSTSRKSPNANGQTLTERLWLCVLIGCTALASLSFSNRVEICPPTGVVLNTEELQYRASEICKTPQKIATNLYGDM